MIPSPLRTLLAALVCLCGVLAVHAEEPAYLFHGGKILLNDGRGTATSALLVRAGRVLAVGNLTELGQRPEARNARRIDLGGGVAVPGLQDAHVELESMLESQAWLELGDCTSYEQLIERVRARAVQLPEGTWILGRGWDQSRWEDRHLPHHLLLSAQVGRHPVYLEHAQGGLALVNGRTLELAHLDGELDPPPRVTGGRVLIDDERRSNGLLLQEARRLARALFPAPDPAQRLQALRDLQRQLLALGLTCVHDHGTSAGMLRTLRELRRRNELVLRVVSYPDVSDETSVASRPTAPLVDAPLDLLSIPGVHLCLDGSLGTRGAALLETYADQPGDRGVLMMDEERLALRLSQSTRARLQPVIEAHGDRAARLALDTLERLYTGVASARDLRARLEGVEVVAPKDWPRFPQLSVLPGLQPGRCLEELAWIGEVLGAERFAGAQAWRMLAPELKRLTLGSSATDVRGADPLRTLYAARVRPQPELLSGLPAWEPVDGSSALSALTSGAAWAAFQDDRRGRLLPGFECDMTVLSLDPTRARAEDLLQARVRLVVINGEVVFRPK